MGKKMHDRYYRDLKQQVYDRLTAMQAFGESKSQDRINGTTQDKIYSFSTYQSYRKQCNYFVDYVRETHPEVTNIKDARQYVREWLQLRVDAHLSAWTVHLGAKALGKLYGITPDDPDYFTPPQRHRADIKRSRGPAVRDAHFSEDNNREFVDFCQGTGLRHREIAGLCGGTYLSRKDLLAALQQIEQKGNELTISDMKEREMIEDALEFPDMNDFVHVKNGKGGRERIAPIIGDNAAAIVECICTTPVGEKVWPHVPGAADVHSYRADYAAAVYTHYARDIKDIPADSVYQGIGQPRRGDVYYCRKDRAGVELDRRAMLLGSKALGHNRISVIADYYLHSLEKIEGTEKE